MIILRQKQHSKVKAFLKKAGNEIIESRNALSKSLGLGNPIAREQLRQKSKKGVSDVVDKIPFTKKELKLAANKKRVKALEKIVKAENYINTHSPGDAASEVVGKLIENPIGTGGTAAGYGTLAFGKLIPGTTAASWSAEAGMRKLSPGYDRGTRRLKAKYDKGKLREIIKVGGDSLALGMA